MFVTHGNGPESDGRKLDLQEEETTVRLSGS
jgi:hypothetical protein